MLAKENAKLAIDSLKEQNETLRENIEENNKKVEELEKKINENQEIVDEYSRFNKEKSEMVSNLHEDIANLKVSISSFDESSGSIDEMKDKLSQDIQNFEEGIERKKSSITNFETSKKDAEEEIKDLTESIKEKQNFKLDFANILNSLKDTKKEVEQKQETLEVKVLDGLRKIDKLKDERAKVQARKLKFDIEIENLKNKMWDDYEITISVAKEMIESLPVDDSDEKTIVKNAEKIRKEIKDLGEVSVGAIEEYKSTKERYDFISNQKADLEETKKKLENLINNMTSIMKQQFEKQFKLINENFNETFKELFGGGKAELKLEDESNVLSSGIEIEVQPPGKKLQSMMLLSGGERALTATALLFAILKLKAPPFCILDEIEAALDDVNVHRFAEYIKKYSKNTQFIVITHRKGTMEVASSTYGVTMQEYGISKVVSMKMK
ncbi:chromosome partition protein Smc [Clostridium sp. CAG:465]|nr:chromosome partition protein Smc [Clostridium sp. CAG:465]